MCDTALRYLNRPYSEAAHIRGLGSPHHGPDELQNLLCLCANCHVLFDGLEIYVDSEGLVRETRGDRDPRPLRRAPGHPIDEAHVAYHRDLCNLNARKPAVIDSARGRGRRGPYSRWSALPALMSVMRVRRASRESIRGLSS